MKKTATIPIDFIEHGMHGATAEQIRAYLAIQSVADEETDIHTIATTAGLSDKQFENCMHYWIGRGYLEFENGYINIPAKAAPKESSNTNFMRSIIATAEQIKGSTISSSEMNVIFFCMDLLGFDADMVQYLCEYCMERDKFKAPYMKAVAQEWSKKGFKSKHDVENDNESNIIFRVYRALGRTGTITEIEKQYITRWLSEYGLSEEEVLKICEKTVLSTDTNRFAYAENLAKQHTTGRDYSELDKLLYES